jgi:hypothetical protein
LITNNDGQIFYFDQRSGHLLLLNIRETGPLVSGPITSNGSALLLMREGLYYFDVGARQLLRIKSVESSGFGGHLLGQQNGRALIFGNKSILFFEFVNNKVEKLNVGDIEVRQVHELAGRNVLIQARSQLLRLDEMTGQLVSVDEIDPNLLQAVFQIGTKGSLLETIRGLFYFDPISRLFVQVEAPVVGKIQGLFELADGRWLIAGAGGWFRFDISAMRVTSIGFGISENSALLHPFANGGALIGNAMGVSRFIADAPINVNTARPHDPRRLDREFPSGDRITPIVAFQHPCAPAVDRLGLALVAQHPERGDQISFVRMNFGSPIGFNLSFIEGERPFVFDRSGDWTLTLHQGVTALTAPLRFSVAAPSLLARIQAAQGWIAVGAGALYLAAFATLLVWTRFSSRAFHMLSDVKLLKWLTFFFYLLRHIRAVQIWVLEPWFQAVRESVQRDALYIDPPLAGPRKGEVIYASVLLGKLRDTRRLWLQGGSGMGKSSVFAAWERSYFSNGAFGSLRAASRRYGFILVTLPVRDYAALSPPEPNRPESWVIEAVRQRLEMFGFGELEYATVRAILKAGHVAIALDGMNEADRAAAFDIFARQFPKVRLLVTSQTRPDRLEGWELWKLPEDVSQLRRSLLDIWLKSSEKGEVLDRRVTSEGLGETIHSGYDLRLIADLAGDEPAEAKLPADRTALYRTVLERVPDSAGKPLNLEQLKKLAWTMVNERRRTIAESELSEAAVKALTREGVRILWQVGKLLEFRHDQMRGFLAASWLIEEMPLDAAQGVLSEAKAFSIAHDDQDQLWGFVAALISKNEDIQAFWNFANEKTIERGRLLEALQKEADRRGTRLIREARSQP